MMRAQTSWILGLIAGLLIGAVLWVGLTQWPEGFGTPANVTTNVTASPTASADLDRADCIRAALAAPACIFNDTFVRSATFQVGSRTYPCHCNTPDNESADVTEVTPWPDESGPQPKLEEWPDLGRIQTTVVAGPASGIGGFQKRVDGALRLTDGLGSDQNPAFLNDDILAFTRFSSGYNQGPAALMGLYLDNFTEFVIWQDEAQNVNTNGNPFTPDKKQICYASDVEDTDEVWCMDLATKQRTRITQQGTDSLFEPSVSSDGKSIAFELHREGDEKGAIGVTDFSGNIRMLVDDDADNRLPQFNPADGRLLFQRRTGPAVENAFKLVVRQTNGTLETSPLTTQGGTDASWASEDEVVYSSEDERFPHAKIFSFDLESKKGRQETFDPAVEDGAPAVSPDGAKLAFESHLTQDENSPSRIWIIQRR